MRRRAPPRPTAGAARRRGRARGTAAGGRRRGRTARRGSAPAASVGGLERALAVAGARAASASAWAPSGASTSTPITKPVGPDALGHQPHRLAGPAAGVQAAGAGGRARPGRAAAPWRPPRRGPGPAGARTPRVCVRARSRSTSGGSCRRCSTARRRRAHRGRPHDLSRGHWRRSISGVRSSVTAARSRQRARGPRPAACGGPRRQRPRDGRGGPGRDRQVEPAGGGRALRRGGRDDRPAGARRPARAGRRLGRRPPAVRARRPTSAASAPRRSPGARSIPRRPSPRWRATPCTPPPTGSCGWPATSPSSAPPLLVVDDVHWADAPSLRWLGQLARRLDELPLGVLCAVRAGEPVPEPELLAELLAAAEPPVRPRPLGPAAAEALVRARLPQADAAFAHACHAVTGGNPFLLRALLGHLVAERIAPTEQVAAGLSAFGPEQVARSVERRSRGSRRAPRRWPARSPSSAGPPRCGTPPGSPAWSRRTPPRWPTRCAPPGCSRATRLAHPLVAGRPLPRPAARRARALARPRRPAARGRARRPGGRRAAPAADRARRRPRHRGHAAAGGRHGRRARRARERRGLPAPRARRAAARPGRRGRRHRRARAGARRAPAPRRSRACCSAAVERAASPEQRCELALRGARALGLAGHFPAAMDARPAGARRPRPAYRPRRCVRLEAELRDERRGRTRRPCPRRSTACGAPRRSSSGDVNAAMAGDDRPASPRRPRWRCCARSSRAERSTRADSLLGTVGDARADRRRRARHGASRTAMP